MPLWWSIGAFALWTLINKLHSISWQEVLTQLERVSRSALLVGVACCVLSYVLVGLGEVLALRIASGRRRFLQPFTTALIANPIGHVLGFALLSGGSLRYRIYSASSLTPSQIGGIVTLAAVPYFLGVGWLLDVCLAVSANEVSARLSLPAGLIAGIACLGLIKDVGWLVFVALRKTALTVRDWSIRLPSLRQSLIQVGLGVAEVGLVAAILYVLMPQELAMDLPAFIAVYLIATLAGQLSHVPAGLGVFEAGLLLMLPHVPPAKLLGAVLAYRAVFVLMPLLVALILLVAYEAAHPSGLIGRRRTAAR